jgi:hypothetical protein
MNPSEVFWETFARVAGWGLGFLMPLFAATLFVILVGATLRYFGYGTPRRGGDLKLN